MEPLEALEPLVPVVKQLERLGVRYYLTGSVASSTWGRGRATMDVDLVADLTREDAAPLASALEADYYVSLPAILEAVANRSCFNVIHTPTALKIDVFVMKNRQYDRVALGRACRKRVGRGNEFMIASPEDVILSKLEWFRLGDEVSDVQWRDVIGVLQVQDSSLDRAYLDKWAGELGVADLLERVWHEAEIPE